MGIFDSGDNSDFFKEFGDAVKGYAGTILQKNNLGSGADAANAAIRATSAVVKSPNGVAQQVTAPVAPPSSPLSIPVMENKNMIMYALAGIVILALIVRK